MSVTVLILFIALWAESIFPPGDAAEAVKHKIEVSEQIAKLDGDTTHLYEVRYRLRAQNFLDHNPDLKALKPMANGRYDWTAWARSEFDLSPAARVELDVPHNTLTVRGTGSDVQLCNIIFERFSAEPPRRLH